MRCHGFTLIEICLAVFIALMLITVAVPSIQRLLNEQKGTQAYDRFNALAHHAQTLAISERRAYVLDWVKTGILMRPDQPVTQVEASGVDRMDISDKEVCDIDFPAALVKKPTREWIFLPSGACEPASVSYQGNGESWVAEYDPLTLQATFTNHEAK